MLRNYIATALRNMARNKLYAAISVFGLAVGFAAALLIALFVRDELTHDRWIPDHERIYRISSYGVLGETKQLNDFAPLGAAEPLMREFPEIEALTQIGHPAARSLRRGEVYAMEDIHWALPNVFDVLRLPAVAGDLRTALVEPDSVVLTRSVARKYFGDDAPLGQVIEVGRTHAMRVTAVLEDLPSKTHLNMRIIAPAHAENSDQNSERFRNDIAYPMYTYIRLAPGTSAARLQDALPAFNERHPELTKRRRPYWLDAVVPIADIHLHPSTNSSMKPGGSLATVYSATAIAILIVVVASINFVSLGTARAARRAVEVGIRKVSGAERRQLVGQFIGESVVYATFGIAIAIVLAGLMLPSFNGLLQRTMTLNPLEEPILPAALLAIVMLVGGAAGAYPALVLSRFAPASVLKDAARSSRGNGRQYLVAAQFAALIVLALVATIITRQVHYTSTAALRLNTDQMLVIDGGEVGACAPAFLTELQALPGVQGATCVQGPILGGPVLLMEVETQTGVKAKSQMLLVDFTTFDVYGLKPRAGRFFAPDFGGDAAPLDGDIALGRTVVINEALARGLGFSNPQNAIGEVIRYSPTIARSATEKRPEARQEIVGVVPDFGANQDLRQNVPPRVFFIEPDFLLAHGAVHVKLAGQQIPETLMAIDRLWKSFGPGKPIERVFLDQTIEDMYRIFARQGQAVAIFAVIAVFVTCLGLFGLAASAAEQRTKEIGVRKALGASRADIVRSLLWDFSKPVLWGSVVAWPIGYIVARRWLENFADRIDVGLWIFPLMSLLALGIALLTVIGHALLVARAAPVSALRYE